ncbi:dihydrolipoamide acetyltransferase family protein, partial [Bordetella bronchiseptica]
AAAREPARGGRVVATPLARRLAREAGLDLAQVSGSGPGGRIKAADVRQAPPALPVAPRDAASPAPAARASLAPAAGEQRIEASALVQSMARRMTQAKQVPHFYLSAEAEVSALLALRQRLNAQADAPRLTLNHFVIAAVARALAAMPHQNRIWNDDHIVQFQGIDVGVAVSTERGLMAPVLHGLDHASLDDIAAQSGALLGRVRAGKATREDMSGGAISISNAGMFNVTYMAPIINPPQSAILGVGSIRELFRPDEQGAPALRREMGLVLAADHRLHDGASALAFLNHVIDLLQDPYRLLRNRPHTKG